MLSSNRTLALACGFARLATTASILALIAFCSAWSEATEWASSLIVATNAYDFTDTVEVQRSDVKSVEPSAISPMPPGLINRLNEKELRDLLGYLLKR